MSSNPLQKSNSPRDLSAVRAHDHLCLIYDSPDEQADAFVPFLHAGLKQGELCVYVVDDTHPEFVLQAFRARGIDIDAYVAEGAFRVVNKTEAHLLGGYFDTNKMISFWEDAVESALQNGYTAMRAAGEMTWALADVPGVDQLVHYESALNEVFSKLQVSGLCQYDRNRFGAKIIKEMIHVHPVVVNGRDVLSNPSFCDHGRFVQSHEDAEVDALLHNISLANQLAEQNAQLAETINELQTTKLELEANRRLQDQLRRALEAERTTREYAESVKAELEEFVTNASEGLHWVGPDGTILWANKAELEMLGYDEDEYIGKNIREIHADQERIADILNRLSSKENLHNYEARLRCKDGSIRHVLINSNVLWRNGKFVHTQCFTRDVTELWVAQQELVKTEELHALNEELHTLARVVSHELQEPIAKIRSYLSLLSVRYKGRLGADADEFITTCSESATIINRMVDDLWLYARMTKTDDKAVPLDSKSVLGKTLRARHADINTARAEIAVGDLPAIRFSERQLRYLFDAVVSNAINYRRPDVPVQIAIDAKRVGGEWVFSVKDNGVGIDPTYARDVFRAFFRISARPNERGTGMGLAICHKIVQSGGGTIWVESTPGEGSTFFFTIPDHI